VSLPTQDRLPPQDRFRARPTPPSYWRPVESRLDGTAYVRRWNGVKFVVIVSYQLEEGHNWLHVSASRPDRCPSHDEMSEVKRDFIGPDRMAVSIWAKSSEHVNIHPNCLHLWSPMSEWWPLPDFTRGSGSI